MIVGIDLGTTNSLVGVWHGGKASLIPNAFGHFITPSAVGLDDNDEILVGQPALERMLTRPDRTAATFKRYMGSNRLTTLGGRQFRPEDLSSFVLRSLKRDVEKWAGEAVNEAVISVPAYFNDAQRKATKIAGELAGLKVERLINEPTAAALAYGLHQARPESQFLVFDLGGGTFDVTVLELFEGVMEVRASAGDNFLGGEDFVAIIIDHFIKQAGNTVGLTDKDLGREPKLYQTLRREAESAKRRLTDGSPVLMNFRWNGQTAEFRFTESDLKVWSEALLARIRDPVERALRDARIRPSQLNEILLVGGATRMPIIRNLVARLFGRFPSTDIHPDEAVALGAAVQAGLKARDASLKEVVLTDVCPYTLGIEVAQESQSLKTLQPGFFKPIIERNTVIPTSRVERFRTVADRQAVMDVRVFQGESRLVRENIFLGKLTLQIPPKPKGQEQIDVRFTYDINGLLEVEATLISSGRKSTIVIEENPGVLSPSEVRQRFQMLSTLKIHPLDQVENRTVLARAERLYEQSLGPARDLINVQIMKFTDAMSTQDQRMALKAREELSAFLNSIETESPLR